MVEARLLIRSARIALGAAKNELLPRLDLVLRYAIKGIAPDLSSDFDSQFSGNFSDYFYGIEFEIPIGNRAALANRRSARLQLQQAIIQLKDVASQVVTDVNVSHRSMETAYRLTESNRASRQAAEERLRALEARERLGERLTPEFLQLKLDAQINLAAERINELSATVEYNNSIALLEQAKGTLLQYYRVVLTESADEELRMP
jgi:outer membrane protein TolC